MIFTAEICWPWDWIETTTIVYCKKKAHFLQFATQLACWRIMFSEQAFGFIFIYLWILFKYLSDAVILKYQHSNLTEVPPAPSTLYVRARIESEVESHNWIGAPVFNKLYWFNEVKFGW